MPSYRFHCRNEKCGADFLRHFKIEEFEKNQYGSGYGCFKCGFPRMAVIKSNKLAKDGFQPGFQRNIMKHCSTYGEYKAHLKRMGLVEIGHEDLPESEDNKTEYWTDDILKKVYANGIKISDREAEALKKGLA